VDARSRPQAQPTSPALAPDTRVTIDSACDACSGGRRAMSRNAPVPTTTNADTVRIAKAAARPTQPSNRLRACRGAIALSVPPNALTHLLGRKQIVDYWGSLSCRFPLSRKSSPNLPLPASRNATAAAK
jgi:hypothetical protein